MVLCKVNRQFHEIKFVEFILDLFQTLMVKFTLADLSVLSTMQGSLNPHFNLPAEVFRIFQ